MTAEERINYNQARVEREIRMARVDSDELLAKAMKRIKELERENKELRRRLYVRHAA